MAKKNFDTFLNSVKSSKLSAAEIEEMTQEIHQKKAAKAKTPAPKPKPAVEKAPATVAPREPSTRGRKPKPPETERLIRVSVDLPESTIIDLKGRTVRERLPMKDFIRRLVERELYGK